MWELHCLAGVFVARIRGVSKEFLCCLVADHNTSDEIRFWSAYFYFAVQVKSVTFYRYIYQLTCAHGLRWKDAAECEVFDLAWSQLSISAANNQGFIRVFDLCWVC
jgi:hypothetical protein